MNAAIRAALLASAFALPAGAAEPARTPPQQPPPQPAKTGKERLGGKHSDEQRVDDCKVPPERRTRPRPAACPWDRELTAARRQKPTPSASSRARTIAFGTLP